MTGSVRGCRFILLGLLCTAVSGIGCSRTGLMSIQEDDLRAHVAYLASDALAGRATGSAGIRRAEEYIASKYQDYGLHPLPGDDDFFMDFLLYESGFDRERTQVAIMWRGTTITAQPEIDFTPFRFSAFGSIEGQVVFAGYGITAPEYEYDDYRGLDVEGKAVLVLRHEPNEADPESRFDGTAMTRHAYFIAKAENAVRHGAVCMVLATDPLHHQAAENLKFPSIMSLEPETGRQNMNSAGTVPIPVVHVSQSFARSIVACGGYRLEELQHGVDGGEKPSRYPLNGVSIRLNVAGGSESRKMSARNVVGYLPVGRPEPAGEWIIIGAHHDHLGSYHGEGDTIYNGADDNASGVSAMLELAQAFTTRRKDFPKNIAFASFSAEEVGLLGANALIRGNLVPRTDMVFMVNLDMIGRNPEDEIQIFADGGLNVLPDFFEEVNTDSLPIAVRRSGGSAGTRYSDHYPFQQAGISTLFATTGLHEDYHQTSDHSENLDYGRMQLIVRLVYGLILRLAER